MDGSCRRLVMLALMNKDRANFCAVLGWRGEGHYHAWKRGAGGEAGGSGQRF